MAKTRHRKELSPIGIKILENLGPEWSDYEDLIEQVSRFVPGEIAWRTAEKSRSQPFLQKGMEVPPRIRNDNTTAIILSGSRTHVRKILNALARTNRVEVQYEQREVYRKAHLIRLSAEEVALREGT